MILFHYCSTEEGNRGHFWIRIGLFQIEMAYFRNQFEFGGRIGLDTDAKALYIRAEFGPFKIAIALWGEKFRELEEEDGGRETPPPK